MGTQLTHYDLMCCPKCTSCWDIGEKRVCDKCGVPLKRTTIYPKGVPTK